VSAGQQGPRERSGAADAPPLLVVALMLGVAGVGATIFAISPLLPDIAAAFGVTVARAGVLPGAFSIALALVAPVIGVTAQGLPRAMVIVAGLTVFATAWIAALFVREFSSLILLAALAGGATGAVLPATYAYAADLSSYERRARLMGRIVSGWSIAILVVVPAMALAAQAMSWRWAFGALACFALAIALLLAVVPRPAAGHGREPLNRALLVASLARVLAHRPTRIVLAANLLNMGAFYAVYSFAGTELRRLNDWGASPAGLVVAAYGVGLAIVTFNGQLIDRWGKKRSAIGALLALGVVLGALPWLASVPLAMAAGIVVWGLVQGTFFTAITTLASEQIPELRGVVVALLSGATYLGVTIYTPLSALLYGAAGYWAVGLEAAAGCLVAAALLARLAPEPDAASLRSEPSPRSR
jgi:predicted MFS family arabinose efflux permease